MLMPTAFGLAAAAALMALVPHVHALQKPIAPKVMITTMFSYEASSWLTNRTDLYTHNITVPGLSPLFPTVHCTKNGDICLWTTGEGQINAAASTMALLMSSKFDFAKTYWYITGIAGGDPRTTTLGGATFARYAVQVEQQYAFDSRDMPSNWTYGFWSYGTDMPGIYPTEFYGTEVFALNFKLAERAYHISKSEAASLMNDSAKAIALRSKYTYSPANQKPEIVLGDVATSDLYWAGKTFTDQFANLTTILTNGTGTLATTAQEDNATIESLLRGHLAGKVDYGRIICMRTVSDFAFAPEGESEYDSFEGQNASGPSFINLYVAGNPVVNHIIKYWKKTYHEGIKPEQDFYGDVFGSLN